MRWGFGDFFGERYQSTPKERIRSIADYLPLFADKPLEFEPGTNRRYSNGGYVVLAAIIEKASGKDYYTFVKENVFTPAACSKLMHSRKIRTSPGGHLDTPKRKAG